jgi:molybdopterin synthase sulfur carrier subunit
MINIHVRLFGFGESPARSEDREMTLPSPATVSTLLGHLAGQLRPAAPAGPADSVDTQGLLIVVNGRQIHHLQGLETPLEEGDAVAIMPPVLGG